jgi:hypothetical protein
MRSLFLVGLSLTTALHQGGAPTGPLDLSRYDLKRVYENRFDRPQKIAREEDLIAPLQVGGWRRERRPPDDAEWIAEGWGGAAVRDGHLVVAPSELNSAGRPTDVPEERRSHMVVWNRTVFPKDFLLEFEMSPEGSSNGLALVLFCATGTKGKDIFDLSLPPRRGEYAAYHSGAIANYTDSYWSRNTDVESVSNRLRKNPGFKEVASGPSRTTGSTNVTHHVRILKVSGHLEVEINGHVVLTWDDPGDALGAGRIGLRSMAGVTKVTYDNFEVCEVVLKQGSLRDDERPPVRQDRP